MTTPPSSVSTPAASAPAAPSAAAALASLTELVFDGPPPVAFELWDGSRIESATTGGPTVRLRSPVALRRLLWAPDELGLGRAYVAGDADLDGDVIETLRALRIPQPTGRKRAQLVGRAARAAVALDAIGPPPPPPPEEVRLRGRRHTRRRDSHAVSHHYDVGNAFYRMMLGPTMTYSCARWGGDVTDIDAAQTAKHDLVCRKLGLDGRHDIRLLDVGCGWGTMAMHAAAEYGARAVGITISEQQFARATDRVKEAGLDARVEIRLQDYRELRGETFDVISSIGMFEHVGSERTTEYFRTLRDALVPGGRLLNHAISKPGGSKLSPRSFIGRYVFPDGELLDVADVTRAMEAAGFEVRDVESLREHYALTLRAWIDALEHHWDAAVREVGEGRARCGRAYMAGSVVGFEEGDIAVHQVLGVRRTAAGASGMPLRRTW